jgi:hypothetical protein
VNVCVGVRDGSCEPEPVEEADAAGAKRGDGDDVGTSRGDCRRL